MKAALGACPLDDANHPEESAAGAPASRIPPSRRQLWRISCGSFRLSRSVSLERARQSKKGPGGSPCCAPALRSIARSPNRRRPPAARNYSAHLQRQGNCPQQAAHVIKRDRPTWLKALWKPILRKANLPLARRSWSRVLDARIILSPPSVTPASAWAGKRARAASSNIASTKHFAANFLMVSPIAIGRIISEGLGIAIKEPPAMIRRDVERMSPLEREPRKVRREALVAMDSVRRG